MSSMEHPVEDTAHRSQPPPADRAVPGPRPIGSLTAGFQVRSYRPGDEKWLVETFSSVFHERSLDEWNWLFRPQPCRSSEVDIRILESEGRLVGSVSHIGTPAWVEGKLLRLAIGCDMMVHPDFRGRGGAELLVKAFRESGHGFDLNFGTVTGGSRQATRRQLGTTAMGWAPRWIRVRTRGAGRNVALRSVVSAVDRIYGRVASWPRPALPVIDLETLGPEVDDLARDSAGFAACIRVRDSAYLRWHWLEDPRTHWRIRAVWGEDAVLRGIAVIGARGEGADRRGVIADLLARDPAALRALVSDAWARLVQDGCHSVTCVYRDPRRWARIALLRSGFRREVALGPGVACGPLSPRAGELVTRLKSWYLTSADTDL